MHQQFFPKFTNTNIELNVNPSLCPLDYFSFIKMAFNGFDNAKSNLEQWPYKFAAKYTYNLWLK